MYWRIKIYLEGSTITKISLGNCDIFFLWDYLYRVLMGNSTNLVLHSHYGGGFVRDILKNAKKKKKLIQQEAKNSAS